MYYFKVILEDVYREEPILVAAEDVMDAGRRVESYYAEVHNISGMSELITEIVKTNIVNIID